MVGEAKPASTVQEGISLRQVLEMCWSLPGDKKEQGHSGGTSS